MQIVRIANHRLSLEFGPAERGWINDALLSSGATRVRSGPDMACLSVYGQLIVFVDEWDGPALISTTVEGDGVIEDLAARAAGFARTSEQRKILA